MSEVTEKPAERAIAVSGILFLLGMVGVASFYFSDIPIPREYANLIDPETYKFQVMVGPAVMVTLAIVAGHFLTRRTAISTPALTAWLDGQGVRARRAFSSQVIFGALGAVVFIAIATTSQPLLVTYVSPEALATMQALDQSLHPITQFAYGVFAEEIVMRWGLFGAVLWFGLKVVKGAPQQMVVSVAVLVASGITVLLHIPVLYEVFETPPQALLLYALVLGFLSSAIACGLVYRRGLGAGFTFKFFALIGLHAMPVVGF